MREQKQKPCICEAADMAHPRAVSSVHPHRRLDSLVLDETLVFQLAYRANSCVSRPRKNSKSHRGAPDRKGQVRTAY